MPTVSSASSVPGANLAHRSTRVARLAPHRLAPLLQDQLGILERASSAVTTAEDALEKWLLPLERASLERHFDRWLDNLETEAVRQDTRPILDAREFGAVGDGRQDDTLALRRAASAAQGGVLRLAPGRYRVSGDDRAALLLSGLRDLVVEASGATLFTDRPGTILRLEDCSGLSIRGLGLDLDPRPVTQGRILTIDTAGDWMDVEIEPGRVLPDQPPFTSAQQIKSSVRGEDGKHVGRPHYFPSFARVEPRGGRVFRLHLPPVPGDREIAVTRSFRPEMRPGAKVVLFVRDHAGSALVVSGCEWLDFDQLSIRASRRFAAHVEASTGVVFTRAAIVPADGELLSAGADGFHCRSNRYGPFFLDCRLRFTADDCFNLYSRIVSVLAQPAPDELVLDAASRPADRIGEWQPSGPEFVAGDPLLLLEPVTGRPLAHARILVATPCQWHGAPRWRVKLDSSAPPLRTRESRGLRAPVASGSEFLSVKGEHAFEVFAVNLATKSDGFVIRGCTFGDNTVTGAKIKASHGLIAGNHSHDHGWCCIQFATELEWQEGFVPRHILVRENRFTNWFGLFTRFGVVGGGEPAGAPPLRNLRFEANVFEGIRTGEHALDLRHAADCAIIDNVLPAWRPLAINSSVRSVHIEGNRLAPG
jgi:hypothetical protein